MKCDYRENWPRALQKVYELQPRLLIAVKHNQRIPMKLFFLCVYNLELMQDFHKFLLVADGSNETNSLMDV